MLQSQNNLKVEVEKIKDIPSSAEYLDRIKDPDMAKDMEHFVPKEVRIRDLTESGLHYNNTRFGDIKHLREQQTYWSVKKKSLHLLRQILGRCPSWVRTARQLRDLSLSKR